MEPLRVAIVGLGTVGGGALKILSSYAPILAERCGRPIEIVAICSRDRSKDRGVDISRLRWVEDPMTLATDSDVDVVIEAIGGAEGIARELVEKALANGKSVVTANKALIAHHGVALATLAEKHDCVLAFEAAVAGGIPIIKALRDGLAANRFKNIIGILNGTCNYILTLMKDHKRSFDDALKDAQAHGYAETEPSFDVDGIDTAHKLAILTGLAYGCAPTIDKVYVEGIRRISLRDIQFADELGYVIKLLGISSLTEHGIEQRVHPCMIAKSSALANVNGVYNAVQVEGDSVGKVFLEGRGAGEGPTASSVVADVMDIARGVKYKPFTLAVKSLKTLPFTGMEHLKCAYYMRLLVIDRPGVLAEITAIFKKEQISLRSFIQHSQAPSDAVQLVLTTEQTQEPAILRVVSALAKSECITEQPHMIRIENL